MKNELYLLQLGEGIAAGFSAAVAPEYTLNEVEFYQK